jgi:hypothetical protein
LGRQKAYIRPDHQSFTFPASFRREERGGGIGWDGMRPELEKSISPLLFDRNTAAAAAAAAAGWMKLSAIKPLLIAEVSLWLFWTLVLYDPSILLCCKKFETGSECLI